MKTYELRSPEDIAALTEEWGFLPFFAGEIPGFSAALQAQSAVRTPLRSSGFPSAHRRSRS